MSFFASAQCLTEVCARALRSSLMLQAKTDEAVDCDVDGGDDAGAVAVVVHEENEMMMMDEHLLDDALLI